MGMTHLAKSGSGRRTHPQAGTVIAHQIGKGSFKIAVAGDQRVIGGIADDRCILAMIAEVVKLDGAGKVAQLDFGIGRIHFADRRGARPNAFGVCLRTAHLSPPAGREPRRGPRR